jgi:hypothetical protein
MQSTQLVRANLKRRRAVLGQDKRANAVTRFNQLSSLKFGQGFTNHGSADAKVLHDFGFTGQLFAG